MRPHVPGLLIVALLLAPAHGDEPAAAPLPPAVKSASAAFDAAKRKAQEEYDAKVKAASKAYLLALDASIKDAMRAGNLPLANRLNALKQSVQADVPAAGGERATGGPSSWAKRVYLSDLDHFDLKAVSNWWGKKGMMRDFKVAVDGVNYPNAIAICPLGNEFGSMKFRLDGHYQTFQTGVAMDDSSAGLNKTAVTFEVLGDDKSLWKSPPVKDMKKTGEARVDITGVKVLELRVNCPGDHDHVHAVWLEPQVLK